MIPFPLLIQMKSHHKLCKFSMFLFLNKKDGRQQKVRRNRCNGIISYKVSQYQKRSMIPFPLLIQMKSHHKFHLAYIFVQFHNICYFLVQDNLPMLPVDVFLKILLPFAHFRNVFASANVICYTDSLQTDCIWCRYCRTFNDKIYGWSCINRRRMYHKSVHLQHELQLQPISNDR